MILLTRDTQVIGYHWCASAFPLLPRILFFFSFYFSAFFFSSTSSLLLLLCMCVCFLSKYFFQSRFDWVMYHVTTAGSLGCQLKCDNQSINHVRQQAHGCACSVTTLLIVHVEELAPDMCLPPCSSMASLSGDTYFPFRI